MVHYISKVNIIKEKTWLIKLRTNKTKEKLRLVINISSLLLKIIIGLYFDLYRQKGNNRKN